MIEKQGERGKRRWNSQRSQRASKRARGSVGCREFDGGDPRRLRPKTSTMRMLRCVPACLGRWRRRGRRRRARRHVRGTRRRRWPRQQRSAATSSLGCEERERSRGGGRARESARGPGKVRGVVGGLQQRAGKQEVAGACSRASGTRASSSWQEVGDDWRHQSAGPARGAGPPAGLPGR